MREMGGLWARLPWLPPLALFFAAASLGLPGTGNFVGEFLILAGSFATAPVIVVLATAGLVLAAAYSLAMVHRSMFGPARSDAPIAAASAREVLMLLSVAACIVALGLYPQPVLDLAERPVALVQQYYAPASSQTGAAAP